MYNSIKSILDDKYNRISQPFDKLNNVVSKVNYNKDIEINILKVKYLFTDECYEKLSKVVETINEISSICHDINYIYELIERDVDDSDFITEIKSFVQGYEHDQITDLQEENFKKLCDDKELYVAIISDEYRHYNFYEMYKKMGELEMKLREEKCILFKHFESELDIGGAIK
ncbi:hypothetical protein [uncultured Clostridium sp.]|uniref:hypothetical protein n=1 Tax=uncultured Clostridium sp. TaxID=59620 RepID=UPI0028ECA940|nr:hypothetical protein [uncultured Clostridium sp.]